jgi:hypothetical protein
VRQVTNVRERATLVAMRDSWPPAAPERDITPEEEHDILQRADEADEGQRRGECVPMVDVLRGMRRAGGAEPIVLDPDFEAVLERRSAEARELDREGLLPSADDHLRKLRTRAERRRAG